MTRRVAFLIAALAMPALAFAPAPLPRREKMPAGADRVVRIMEGFRAKPKPDLGPYGRLIFLAEAREMVVKTRPECAALLPYLKDPDARLRFVAMHALAGAFREEVNPGWIPRLDSEDLFAATRRFEFLIDGMAP